MSLEAIVVALVAIGLGAAFLLGGYRLGLILIPLWGFFAGFILGAEVTQSLFGEGFLSTITSWLVGIGLGLLFALLSYFSWYAAIVILFGIIGYWMGAGLMELIGLSDDAIITVAVGIVAGLAFAFLAFVTGTPVFILVLITALGGAHAIVAGVLIILGRIDVEALGEGVVPAIISDTPFWWLATLVLAAIGVVVQLRSIGDYVLDYPNRTTRSATV